MENLVVCKCPVVVKNSLISKKPPSSPTSPLRHLRSFSSLFNRSVTLRMALPPSGQNPVVEQQKVIISNKHGEKLVGLLHDTGSNEIVILCHGFRSTKDNDTMVNLAKALEKEGTSSFRFDFAGNGTRTKNDFIIAAEEIADRVVCLNRESEGSFAYGNYWREADDLRSVMEHFRGASRAISAILGHSKGVHMIIQHLNCVDATAKMNTYGAFTCSKRVRAGDKFSLGNVCVDAVALVAEVRSHLRWQRMLQVETQIGILKNEAQNMKGGDVVLLYASKYQDITTVFNVSGRYDLKRGIEERIGKDFMEKIKQDGFIDVKNGKGSVIYRVTEESLMDRLNTDIHKACLVINKDCRVFTIHGSADEIIPVEDALEFAKIIPNHSLHIIEGANHSYTSHQTELAAVVLKLMKATLQQD
ncbi:hypothetical protein POTOM_057155 [Populus tomentosa]|uniref:Alpha/beta-Hydrolases superfamily protein n=1 Tax=Populus tomentosa TaxID=118781 RepID=A0A8X8C4P5_POPTO|nr:hypothetical protein POTOM_057155 [Populus tomentosa]